MKKFPLILFLLCLVFQTNAQNIYEDALTAASYAYSHSKKAHGANNVFHTQEYADKAIESFLKVEELADACGCEEANETAYEARSDMESSITEDTYERSRYYAKRAKDLGSKLLEQLTICQANGDPITEDVASIDEEDEAIAEVSQEVINQQQALEEKKRQLEIEQQKLEQQIAAQQQKKAEFEAKRAEELKEKTLIKSKAEQALKKLESALQELSVALNDEDTSFESANDYSRSENELKNESIDDTKSFYINRAKELTKSAIQQFAGNSEN